MARVIPPVPGLDDQFFWDGVAEGRLLLQRCADCATLRHPPLPMCGRCGSLERDVLESAGRGSVYSWITSQHPSEPDSAPRIVALIDLVEGVRLVSNLRHLDAGDIRAGMAVEVFFDTVDGVTLPQFRPVAELAT